MSTLAMLGGCGGQAGGPTPPAGQHTVTVLAAASLTESFTTLAKDYERAHPGVDVRVSFGSSTTLAQQVAQGAPADLVAFAGESAVRLLPAGTTRHGGSATLAANVLEIATPPSNPAHVASLADLARRDVAAVLCASTAPCGKAADEVLAKARVRPHVVSRELDVKATLAKVRLGEVDAAVVYHSDVESAGPAVHGVGIPPSVNERLHYPLLWLNDQPQTMGLAHFLTGPVGRDVLTHDGFLAP